MMDDSQNTEEGYETDLGPESPRKKAEVDSDIALLREHIQRCDEQVPIESTEMQLKEREYQTFLVEVAKKRNIIICLPTGSGKTFIAVQLTKYYLPTAIKEKKKIIFIANTVPLAKQQAEYFRSNLSNAFLNDSYVECLTGDRQVDKWKGNNWEKFLGKCHIIFMTPQILSDAINHGYLELKNVTFLVIDECHNSDKDHPMNKVMGSYQAEHKAGQRDLPRVIGLTATIVNGKKKTDDITYEVREAENRLCAKAITYYDTRLVSQFSTTAHENIRFEYFSKMDTRPWSDSKDRLLQDLRHYLDELDKANKETWKTVNDVSVNSVNHHTFVSSDQLFTTRQSLKKDLNSMVKDIVGIFDDLGPFCARLAAIHKRACLHALLQYDFQSQTLTLMVRHLDSVLERFISKVERCMQEADKSLLIQEYTSNKLDKLITILTSYSDKMGDAELCGIIFVEKRITAQILCWYLQDLAEAVPKFKFLKPDFAVGIAAYGLDPAELRATSKEQARVLSGFHKKTYNIIVATKVIEEGLNVPSCNVVIRWDKVATFPSYMQSMGRARARDSKFIAFIDKASEEKDRETYNYFQDYNVKLIKYLKQNAENLDDSTEKIEVVEDEIPAFEPNGQGKPPRITAIQSVSIAHRYCQTLPCDKLVTLAPVSWWVNANDLTENQPGKRFKAFVKFPSNSVIREVVEGKVYPNKYLAKRSAYLEACKLLYARNALNDNLLPAPRTAVPEITKFMDEMDPDKLGTDLKSAIKQGWYPKKIPRCVAVKKILPMKPCRCYRIIVELTKPTIDEIVSMYQFEKKKFSYCIISMLDLSMIPNMMMTVSPAVGSLRVRLKKIDLTDRVKGVLLRGEEVALLQEFERYIFGDLLQLKRDFMSHAKVHSSSMLIAPIIKCSIGDAREERYSFDWELVKKVQASAGKEFAPPGHDKRKDFIFSANDYDDAVVVPWYRPEKLLYPVVKILSNQTPLSDYPYDKSYNNYGAYFLKRYPDEVKYLVDQMQPLLQCKQISENLNFFKFESGYKSSKEERRTQRNNAVELIPELTLVHPMPASLYIMAKLLPSILQRIYRYLCAFEVHEVFANGTPHWTAVSPTDDEFDVVNGASCDPCETTRRPGVSKICDEVGDSGLTKQQQKPVTLTPNDSLQTNKTVELQIEKTPFDYVHPKDLPFDRKAELDEREEHNVTTEGLSGEALVEHYVDMQKERETDIVLQPRLPSQLCLDEQKDLCDCNPPSLFNLMEAITAEASMDKVNFERFEVMGDSFLKFCVTQHMFLYFPELDEGQLTQWRSSLVSNKCLQVHGSKLKLGDYLAGGKFLPSLAWLPPSFEIPSSLSDVAAGFGVNEDVYNGKTAADLVEMSNSPEELEKFVREAKQTTFGKMPANAGFKYTQCKGKSIADCVEALIGAYFVKSGVPGALHAMKTIGLRGPTHDNGVKVPFGEWPGFSPNYDPKDDEVERHLPLYRDLESLIEYKFTNPWLLVEAFSHACYTENRVTECYQRLEFLGDAVLDFLTTCHIYRNNPAMDPGQVTDLRSALVNNVTFASLAVRYGLHTYLKHNSKPLQNNIDLFVESQVLVKHHVTGHFKLISDNDSPTVTAQDIEAPKVLGDLFESLAGAVYLDSGMSLDTTWSVFYRLMQNEIDTFSAKVPKSPVRELHEMYPSRKLFKSDDTQNDNGVCLTKSGCQYVVLTVPVKNENGEDVRIIGSGANKTSAKLGAAKYYLYLMKKLADAAR